MRYSLQYSLLQMTLHFFPPLISATVSLVQHLKDLAHQQFSSFITLRHKIPPRVTHNVLFNPEASLRLFQFHSVFSRVSQSFLPLAPSKSIFRWYISTVPGTSNLSWKFLTYHHLRTPDSFLTYATSLSHSPLSWNTFVTSWAIPLSPGFLM